MGNQSGPSRQRMGGKGMREVEGGQKVGGKWEKGLSGKME